MEGHAAVTERAAMRTSILTVLLLLANLAGADEFEVPFRLQSDHRAMLVSVAVNGRAATMLVDTGAASTFVSAGLVGVHATQIARARFRSEGGMEVHGIRREAGLTLGTAHFRTTIIASNLETLSQRYGIRVDGVLGQDVLRRFRRVTIDVERGALVLTPSESR
jgi:hypothetical protein